MKASISVLEINLTLATFWITLYSQPSFSGAIKYESYEENVEHTHTHGNIRTLSLLFNIYPTAKHSWEQEWDRDKCKGERKSERVMGVRVRGKAKLQSKISYWGQGKRERGAIPPLCLSRKSLGTLLARTTRERRYEYNMRERKRRTWIEC